MQTKQRKLEKMKCRLKMFKKIEFEYVFQQTKTKTKNKIFVIFSCMIDMCKEK